ncbi:DUF1097 domain-containing protein [Aurantiacibacter poecillastricola]|uniref:DUF1097 domain-containing protein n=1 Tax=Aurantiacibacter poecillastricola TaxID=3064385 RepID=UPI00273D5174|nr:DUF1097 domain-containing protein [Aurantiacibacter sp. 219JJ12-13]MDP5260076.1 DUF1097 domain-containing protein [Aurantiacibacter sp. 219JJ12-13]
MTAYLALALSVGLLAILDTWLFGVPLASFLPGLVWISFIAWGCHFHSGGGVKGMTTAILGMSFGALVGMVAVILAGGAPASLGDLAAPVAVGLGAFVICLASAVPFLATIPASVYGFASIAGPILLAGMTPVEAIVPTVVSIVIGAVFGIASEYLANALTRKDPVAAAVDPAE